MAHVTGDTGIEYTRKGTDTGIFTYVVHGTLDVAAADASITLGSRDGLGVIDEQKLTFTSNSASQFIIIEVPLT
jgi:hypothetical protein